MTNMRSPKIMLTYDGQDIQEIPLSRSETISKPKGEKMKQVNTYRQNQRVQIITDPYGGLLGTDLVGQVATVTTMGNQIVGLKLDTGLQVKCWLTKDSNGNDTIATIP
jgi:hypothetical protein